MKIVVPLLLLIGLTACTTSESNILAMGLHGAEDRFTEAKQLYLGEGLKQDIPKADQLFEALAKSDPGMTASIANFFLRETEDLSRIKKWAIRWHAERVAKNVRAPDLISKCITNSPTTENVKSLASTLVYYQERIYYSEQNARSLYLSLIPHERAAARRLAERCLGELT